MAAAPPPSAPAANQSQLSEGRLPYLVTGIVAGALGGAVVALFFLVVDWLAGRPFWTPHALGSALFLAESVEPTAPPDPIIILAYTAVHGVVFVAFGIPAASEVLARASSMRSPAAAVVLGALLFTVFEIFFLALGLLFFEGLIGTLGVARVTMANALAAAAMAAFLWDRARRQA